MRARILFLRFASSPGGRPVVVLTPEAIGLLRTVMDAPITSTIRRVPNEVVVGEVEGLKIRSTVNVARPRRGELCGRDPSRAWYRRLRRSAARAALQYTACGSGPAPVLPSTVPPLNGVDPAGPEADVHRARVRSRSPSSGRTGQSGPTRVLPHKAFLAASSRRPHRPSAPAIPRGADL
jgi:hypothetical protein